MRRLCSSRRLAPSRERIQLNYEDHLDATQKSRHATLKRVLSRFSPLFRGKRVLDYGASSGLSAAALIELGADSVVGIEPDLTRVEQGRRILGDLDLHQIQLVHVEDTTDLSFDDGEFQFILSNAVFEHIPQPRDASLREVWRMLGRWRLLPLD